MDHRIQEDLQEELNRTGRYELMGLDELDEQPVQEEVTVDQDAEAADQELVSEE